MSFAGAEVIGPLELGHDLVLRGCPVRLETIWGLIQGALAKVQRLDKSPTQPFIFLGEVIFS
jgi:hypothetical protein